MNKFFKSAWLTLRKQQFGIPGIKISSRISDWLRSSGNNLNSSGSASRSYARAFSTSKSRWSPTTPAIGISAPKQKMGLAFLSLFLIKPIKDGYNNAYDVEKKISDMVGAAETLVVEGKLSEAKTYLNEALKLAEEMNVFSNVSSVYDLLSTIAFKEGSITEAEDILVTCIEKLIQLGYPENHNSIVRFKLKLSRLYQSVGNHNMAELGFRDCINAQEEKMAKNKVNDDLTGLIYVSSLFWYGRFLIEKGEMQKAKGVLKKSLKALGHTKSVTPGQIMVVLYYNAEVAYILKEYNESLHYLYQAITICRENDPDNEELPLYLVKVGYIQIVKGLYSEARFWCDTAAKLSEMYGNAEAASEASHCMKTIEKVTKNSKQGVA